MLWNITLHRKKVNKMTFEEVVKKVDKLLWQIAHKYSIKGNDVEDNYQECLTKTYEVYKDYNDDYALTTYLKTILENHMKTLCSKDNTDKRTNKLGGKNVRDIKGYDLSRLIPYLPKYTKEQEHILSVAYTILEDEKRKDIIERILYGETQVSISNELGVSKQAISKHFVNYINKVIEGVNKL